MSETSETPDACIGRLEAVILEMQQQTTMLMKLLQACTPLPTIETEKKLPSHPDNARKPGLLKPGVPQDFSGDQKNGKAFLASCRTYICLVPKAFLDEETKIIWATSFMKTGRASQ